MKHPFQTAAVLTIFVMIASAAGALPHRHGRRTRVRFLATSTLIRGTWGWNEDTYLAEILLPKQNETVLVRLVDAYSSDWPPLSHKVLASGNSVLSVKRDAGCDRPFGDVLLRSAPGDLMAILPERLSYQPQMDQTPAAGTMLPCYRVLRR